MRVHIYVDEWYPVYSASDDGDPFLFLGVEAEVDAELLDELESATRRFNRVQQKLGEIYESAKAARLSVAQQQAERRS